MTKDAIIKRYLSSISDSVKQSSTFGSIYYTVKYESEIIKIRFSDHFSIKNKKNDIDIIKQQEFYIIKTLETSYPCTSDNILLYLKSILLLYPEFSKVISKYSKAYYTLRTQKDILEAKSISDESIIAAAKLYLDEQKEEKDNLQKTKNELNAKNQQYDNLLSRVNEIKSIINKIKK